MQPLRLIINELFINFEFTKYSQRSATMYSPLSAVDAWRTSTPPSEWRSICVTDRTNVGTEFMGSSNQTNLSPFICQLICKVYADYLLCVDIKDPWGLRHIIVNANEFDKLSFSFKKKGHRTMHGGSRIWMIPWSQHASPGLATVFNNGSSIPLRQHFTMTFSICSLAWTSRSFKRRGSSSPGSRLSSKICTQPATPSSMTFWNAATCPCLKTSIFGNCVREGNYCRAVGKNSNKGNQSPLEQCSRNPLLINAIIRSPQLIGWCRLMKLEEDNGPFCSHRKSSRHQVLAHIMWSTCTQAGVETKTFTISYRSSWRRDLSRSRNQCWSSPLTRLLTHPWTSMTHAFGISWWRRHGMGRFWLSY